MTKKDDNKKNNIITRSKKRKLKEIDKELSFEDIEKIFLHTIYIQLRNEIIESNINTKIKAKRYIFQLKKTLKSYQEKLNDDNSFFFIKDLKNKTLKLHKKRKTTFDKSVNIKSVKYSLNLSSEIFINVIKEIEKNLKKDKFNLHNYVEKQLYYLEKILHKDNLISLVSDIKIIDKKKNISEIITRVGKKNNKESDSDYVDEDYIEEESDEEEFEEKSDEEEKSEEELEEEELEELEEEESDEESDEEEEFDEEYIIDDEEEEDEIDTNKYNEQEFIELLETEVGKLSNEDRGFAKYIYGNQKNGIKRDLGHFKKLTKNEKINFLDLLEQINKENMVNKPYLFRALQSKMPLKIKAEVIRKLELSGGERSGSDNYKLNSWIEALLNVPFGKIVTEKITKEVGKKKIGEYLKKSKKTLNNAVYGHVEAKNKILQIIAQNITNPMSEGIVIGIYGPMGNGKTTLVEEGIAKVLGKPFVHIPLGGATDSSFLDGHSYTYEGSLWGKIIDVLMKAKVMNPIIYFDELDKVSKTDKGNEIINVLMHLIDLTQNKFFQDKYFTGIEFDLSKAIFIFSYNEPELINPILRDRIIEVKTRGFKTKHKLEIAKKFLLPKILKDVGYKKGDIEFGNNIYRFLIENYTFEGGVRKFKELLYEIVRELNLRDLIGKKIFNKKIKLPFIITEDMIVKDLFLKIDKFTQEKIHESPQVGKINGMYATSNHTGGISVIEASDLPTESKLQLELTGQQGNVMKESMSVAKTVAWNIIPNKIKNKLMEKWKKFGASGLHIHCPEGATPKDGPSAGLAIASVMVSAITKIPINNEIAITGEIDLSGNALEIGGLVDKLYGAKKAGIKCALCPRQNKKDFDKIKKEYPDLIVDGKFTVLIVDNIWDVLDKVLIKNDLKFNNYISR